MLFSRKAAHELSNATRILECSDDLQFLDANDAYPWGWSIQELF
eukprot:UN10268